MKHYSSRILGLLLIIVMILFLPVLINSNALEPICSLSIANAQDNPCLAQEATLSVLALQATLDGLNYQGTIEALESQLANVQSPTIPELNSSSSLPFIEDFSTNQRGWPLSTDTYGSVTLSQSQLRISANADQTKSVQIPGDPVGDNFYIQVDVTPRFSVGAFAAIQLCDSEALTMCHAFFIYPPQTYQTYEMYIGVFDQGNELFETKYPNLIRQGDSFTIGLEAINGFFTIYLNGEATETTNIVPYGSVLTLRVTSLKGAQAEAFFDNVVIRETR